MISMLATEDSERKLTGVRRKVSEFVRIEGVDWIVRACETHQLYRVPPSRRGDFHPIPNVETSDNATRLDGVAYDCSVSTSQNGLSPNWMPSARHPSAASRQS